MMRVVPSVEARVRGEDAESLLPGEGGLTRPADDSFIAVPSGFRARVWSARRWWLAPVFTAMIGSGAAAAAFFLVQPPAASAPTQHAAFALVRYESSGSGTEPQSSRPGKDLVSVVRTEAQLIAEPQSCAVAARDVELRRALPWLEKQDLDDPATQWRIAGKLRPLFTAGLVPNTELVRIESKDADGAVAAAVCNAFADAFIARCRARFVDTTPAVTSDAKLEPLRAQIKELYAQRQQLTAAADTTEVIRQQGLVAKQIEDCTSKRQKTVEHRTQGSARLERLAEPSADGIAEAFARRKQQRLDEEKARDALFQQAFKDQVGSAKEYAAERGAGKTEQHRDVIIAADRMHRAEAMAAQREKELSAVVDAALAREMSAVVADAKSEGAEVVKVANRELVEDDKMLTDFEAKATALAAERVRHEAIRSQIDQVNAEIERKNRECDKLAEQIPAALAKAGLQPTYSFQVVRRAEAETVKESPNTLPPAIDRHKAIAAISAGGVGLGFCVGLLLTLATDALRGRPGRSGHNTQMLGSLRIGSIPDAAPARRPAEQDRKAVQLAVAEGFRHLRNSLLAQIGPIPPGAAHLLAITSAHRGDGRSCVAVGLAVSLAKAGRRVLLIDADLRNPGLHRIFSAASSPGLAELIEGRSDAGDAIARTDTANVSLLPAGFASVDPGELLAWQDIGSYLTTIGRNYDHVLIDAAPLLENADGHTLIESVRNVLLVTMPSTGAVDVERAMEMVRSKKGKVVGAVMNRA